MAPEKAPAFQFYVRDWRSSRRVQVMTFAERGMYLEMLIEQWDKGAAPSSPEACAVALGGATAAWEDAWSVLAPNFATRKRDGQLVNAKLEAIRRKAKKYQKEQSVKGLRGAKARWQGHSTGMPQLEPAIAKNGSASAFASSSAFAIADQEQNQLISTTEPKALAASSYTQDTETRKAMAAGIGRPYQRVSRRK